MKKHYFFLLFVTSCFCNAQALLQENFDYTAGISIATSSTVDPATGWSTHSGTTNPILVTNPGLTFINYYGSGVGNAAGVNNTGIDMNKTFTAQTSNAVYTSFLLNVTTATIGDEYFFHIGANPVGTQHRARVFCQPISGNTTQFQLGLSFNASAAQSVPTNQFNYGQTYLVVLKYNIVTGAANDSVSMYVFDSSANIDTEPTSTFIGPLVSTTTGNPPAAAPDVNPGTVCLRQYNALQRIIVDAIRVSTVWDLNSTLSTQDNNFAAVKLYPNPVKDGILHLELNDAAVNTIEIHDLLGKTVFSLNNFSNTLDINSLNNGLYILNLKGENGVRIEKIVVAKN